MVILNFSCRLMASPCLKNKQTGLHFLFLTCQILAMYLQNISVLHPFLLFLPWVSIAGSPVSDAFSPFNVFSHSHGSYCSSIKLKCLRFQHIKCLMMCSGTLRSGLILIYSVHFFFHDIFPKIQLNHAAFSCSFGFAFSSCFPVFSFLSHSYLSYFFMLSLNVTSYLPSP